MTIQQGIVESDSTAASQKQLFRNVTSLESIDKTEESSKMLGNNKCDKRSSFSRMALKNQKSLDDDRITGNINNK